MASSSTDPVLGSARKLWSCVGKVSGLAFSRVREEESGDCGESRKHLRKFRVGSLGKNTLRGRVCEVAETLSRRKRMFVVSRKLDTVVAIVIQSRGMTPGINTSVLEMTRVLLVWECWWWRSGLRKCLKWCKPLIRSS